MYRHVFMFEAPFEFHFLDQVRLSDSVLERDIKLSMSRDRLVPWRLTRTLAAVQFHRDIPRLQCELRATSVASKCPGLNATIKAQQ
jgi:hypothetical protein